MAKPCPGPIEVADLQFKLQCQLKAFHNQDVSALPNLCSLLACASRYGLFFLGLNTAEFQVVQTKTVFNYGPKEKDVSNYPRRPIQLPSIPKHLSVNCDSTILAVVIQKDQCPTVIFYDVLSFLSQTIKVIKELRLSASPNVEVKEVNWNPSLSNIFTACKSDNTLGVYELKGDSIDINELPAAAGSTCFCWSPKGKQIAVGSKDAKITQYKPDLKAVKMISGPKLESPCTIINLQWVSNYQFIGVYQMQDGSCCIMVVDAPKTGDPTFTNYYDICYSGSSRPAQFFMLLQQTWNVLMVASSNSTEVGVLACTGDTWTQWILSDTARAELPLGADHQETFPVGLTFDISPINQLPWGESSIPPCPLLCILSHQGVLCIFNVVNLKPGLPSVCTPPDPVADMSGINLFITPSTVTPLKPSATVPSVTSSIIIQSTPVVGKDSLAKSLFGGQATVTPIKPQQVVSQGTSLFGGQTSIIPVTKPPVSNVSDKYSSIFASLNPTSSVSLSAVAPVKPVVVSAAPKSEPSIFIKAPQAQVSVTPKPQPTITKTTTQPQPVQPLATPQNVNSRSAEETLALLSQFVIDEKASLDAEIAELIRVGRNLKLTVGTDEEMLHVKEQIEALEAFVKDAVEISQGQSNEIHSLKQNCMQSWAWFEEAKSNYSASKNEVVNLLIKVQSLDSLSEKRLRDIEQLAYHVDSQISALHKALDEQWDNFQDYAKKRHRFKMPTMETIFQTMVKQTAVLQKQEYNLKGLGVRVKPKNKSNIRSLLVSLDKEAELTEGFQSLRLDPQDILQLQLEKIKKQSKQLSGAKVKKLQNLLENRPVARITADKHYASSWAINRSSVSLRESLRESLKKLGDISLRTDQSISETKVNTEQPSDAPLFVKGVLSSSQTSAFAPLAQASKSLLMNQTSQEAVRSSEPPSFFGGLKPLGQNYSTFTTLPATSLGGPPISNASTSINTNIAGKCLRLTDVGSVGSKAPDKVISVSLFGAKNEAASVSAASFSNLLGSGTAQKSTVSNLESSNLFGSGKGSLFAPPTTTPASTGNFFGSLTKSGAAAATSAAAAAPLQSLSFGSTAKPSVNNPGMFGVRSEPIAAQPLFGANKASSIFAPSSSSDAQSVITTASLTKSPSAVGDTFSLGINKASTFGSSFPPKSVSGFNFSTTESPPSQSIFDVASNVTSPSLTFSSKAISEAQSPQTFGISKPFGVAANTTTTAVNSENNIFRSVTVKPSTQQVVGSQSDKTPTPPVSTINGTKQESSIFAASAALPSEDVKDETASTHLTSVETTKTTSSIFAIGASPQSTVSSTQQLFEAPTSSAAAAAASTPPGTIFGGVTTSTGAVLTTQQSASGSVTPKSTPSSFRNQGLATTTTSSSTETASSAIFGTVASTMSTASGPGPASSSEGNIFASKNEGVFASSVLTSTNPSTATITTSTTPFGSSTSIFSTSKTDKEQEVNSGTSSASSIFGGQPLVKPSASATSFFGTPSTSVGFGAAPVGGTPVSNAPFGIVSTGSVFGSASNSPSTFGTTSQDSFATTQGFGSPVTPATTSQPFDSPVTPVTTSQLFGTPVTPATTSQLFGSPMVPVTSSQVFGSPATPVATTQVFGSPVVPVTSSQIFGSPATPVTTTQVFGSPVVPVTSSQVFGSPATPVTTTQVFGSPVTTTSSFGQPSGFGASSGFAGIPSPSAATPTAFGQAASFGGSIFGAATPSTTSGSGNIFATSGSFGGGSGFGATSTTASGSAFGSSVVTNAQQPQSGPFGFGSLSVGGGSSSSNSIFGGAGASSGFGQPVNPFGKVEQKSFGSPAANIFATPAATTTASTNIFGSSTIGTGSSVFGASSFGSSSPFGGASSFGGQKPTTFGQPSAFGQNAFGSVQSTGPFTGSASSPVAQSGFGSAASFQKPSGFGSAPVFGGPAFGSAPGFGGAPTFGGSAVFGSPDKVFGSTGTADSSGGFGAAPAQASAGFGNLAAQNTVGFGNLAQQTNVSNSMPFSGSSSFTSWR